MARIAMAAFALLLAGCDVVAGIDGGIARDALDCDTDAHCNALVVAPSCRASRGCIDHRCAFVDAPRGTLLPEQKVGDCVQEVCDGEGGAVDVPVAEDAPDDDNPCTKDICTGTTAEHQPLSSAPCYSGPPGSEGTGTCKAGTVACENGQPKGGCAGEVVPRAGGEICDGKLLDEDCDGLINEEGAGCVCVPGAIEACYTGGPATAGIGLCKAGQHGCAPDGQGYGPCIGETTPAAEACDPEERDEDCNGLVNEGGSDCVCGDGFVSNSEPCDDGNLDSTDACTTDCALPICGDGFVQPVNDEQCEDQNGDSTDACTTACTLAACGDLFVQPIVGEQCEDGDATDDGPCLASCKRRVAEVYAGALRTCVVFRDGGFKCWGSNTTGQLGLGDTQDRGDVPGEMGSALPLVNMGAGNEALAIAMCPSMNALHTCALLQGGRVKCWGSNGAGQLGIGDNLSRGDEPGEMSDALPEVELGTGVKAIAVAAGRMHTCALLDGGLVKCWGRNFYGQLGLGDTQDRGDEPGEMGDALPAVDLGTGKKAIAITAGLAHTCARLDDGHLACWGMNDAGQLGLGDTLNRGGAPGEMGDALPKVNLGTDREAIAIAAGEQHTCALLDDSHVKCWGYNDYGQLGIGAAFIPGDGPGQMGDALPAVDLGAGANVTAIDAGRKHTCALLDDGHVKCWGFNAYGQLGVGDTMAYGETSDQMGDALPKIDVGAQRTVSALSVGANHTCVLLDNGHLKCWGIGGGGALGLGDVNNRGDEFGEMGDDLPPVITW